MTIDLPVQIHQYNKLMGGVDLVDGIRGKARRTLMTKRWTLKVFHYLLEISIFNLFTLQKKPEKDVGTYAQFKKRLCSQLIDHGTHQTHTKCHYLRKFDILGTAVHGSVLKKSKVIYFLFKKRSFLMHGSLLRTISRKY